MATTVADEVPGDLVEVGRVMGAHGVKGRVKIAPHGSVRDTVMARSRDWWLIKSPPGRPDLPEPAVPLRVLSMRIQLDVVVAQIEGIDDRDAAQALKGARIAISRAAFPVSADDEYYWVDLIGCRVANPVGVELGEVAGIEEFGAHPLLRVVGPDHAERLIPFTPQHVESVDVAQRRIVVDWNLDY